jgi:hypothetical protein
MAFWPIGALITMMTNTAPRLTSFEEEFAEYLAYQVPGYEFMRSTVPMNPRRREQWRNRRIAAVGIGAVSTVAISWLCFRLWGR